MSDLDDAIEKIANAAPNIGQHMQAALDKLAASAMPRPDARQILYDRVVYFPQEEHGIIYKTFEGSAETVMYAVMRHAFPDLVPPTVVYGEDKGRGPVVKLKTRYESAGKIIDNIEKVAPTIRAVVTWTDDNRLSFAVGELVM